MKRVSIAVSVVLLGSIAAFGNAGAADKQPTAVVNKNSSAPGENIPQVTVPSQQPAPVVPAPSDLIAEQKRIKEWVSKLNGTEWSIYVKPLSTTGKAFQDTLTFEERKVSSQQLSKKGYPASNYTLRVQNNDQASWDTMQSNTDESIALWSAQITGDSIRGNLNKRPKKGSAENYTFSGSRVVTPPAAAEKPATGTNK